jgi:hypothetical protein
MPDDVAPPLPVLEREAAGSPAQRHHDGGQAAQRAALGLYAASLLRLSYHAVMRLDLTDR